jgi:hypothetical protein
MANPLAQIGTFRGQITSYGINSAESGAVAINITVGITEIFHEGEWFDWTAENMEVSGDIWVVKKDNTINEKQVRALVDFAGWDGSFVSVSSGTWQPTPVQISVDEDTYKNVTRYKISWVNAYDSTPGGGNVSPEKAKEFQTRYGSQLRALVGSAKTAATSPATGKPTKPAVKPKAAPAPAEQLPLPPRGEQLTAEQLDEVPF